MTRDAFDRYLAEIRAYPVLDREEELALARRVREGDGRALEQLVNANLRFVVAVARRYAGRGVPLDELVNEGNLGLVRAARRFDEARGVRFVSYAVWWIRQAIHGALESQARIVRVPQARLQQARKVAAARRRLGQRIGRDPRSDEVAVELGVAGRRVHEALTVGRGDMSLDAPVAPVEAGTGSMLEFLPDAAAEDPAAEVDREALESSLRRGLLRLPEREREILRRYYGLDGNDPVALTEIGRDLGISRERAGKLREQALRRLRTGATAAELRTFRPV